MSLPENAFRNRPKYPGFGFCVLQSPFIMLTVPSGTSEGRWRTARGRWRD